MVKLTSKGVENLVSFIDDKKWNESKKLARLNGLADNWVEIIDYYNSIRGNHVLAYSILDKQKYRILRVLDSGEVLLMDGTGRLVVEDYDIVLESRKQFFYSDTDLKPKEFHLPEIHRIEKENLVTIQVPI